ncbi:hypothetical protein CEK64_02450 [Xanthomonas sontii]|nr:hypothetical protein CEK64_02450 [Xanthomonas sontii]
MLPRNNRFASFQIDGRSTRDDAEIFNLLFDAFLIGRQMRREHLSELLRKEPHEQITLSQEIENRIIQDNCNGLFHLFSRGGFRLRKSNAKLTLAAVGSNK